MPIAAVNPWLYRPRWFYNPFIVPGSVLTYNVVPYPSSVTIAPASIVHETVLAPQAKAYHSPPKYSSNSPPPISHTAVAVKPQSHGHHTSRRVSFRGGHYSHSQSSRGNHGMLGRRQSYCRNIPQLL
ncbi:hypothetical protein C343_04696 [Cryptococcus neoformans C23]|nr:hypothetical protein C343_04696 [Cryptococcus neoformans var. grubii C23]OXG78866.1 hypothetical protein C349_04623 [Cryptococcus neoformans var. grubii Br795]OXG94167.1 hypothetical protein C345_04421 [Cryptococcus neoformans var. grubii A2-102-5]OXH28839.1 hypothetical protein J005_04549 [Cryptococcus neoformans var. grubii]